MRVVRPPPKMNRRQSVRERRDESVYHFLLNERLKDLLTSDEFIERFNDKEKHIINKMRLDPDRILKDSRFRSRLLTYEHLCQRLEYDHYNSLGFLMLVNSMIDPLGGDTLSSFKDYELIYKTKLGGGVQQEYLLPPMGIVGTDIIHQYQWLPGAVRRFQKSTTTTSSTTCYNNDTLPLVESSILPLLQIKGLTHGKSSTWASDLMKTYIPFGWILSKTAAHSLISPMSFRRFPLLLTLNVFEELIIQSLVNEVDLTDRIEMYYLKQINEVISRRCSNLVKNIAPKDGVMIYRNRRVVFIMAIMIYHVLDNHYSMPDLARMALEDIDERFMELLDSRDEENVVNNIKNPITISVHAHSSCSHNPVIMRGSTIDTYLSNSFMRLLEPIIKNEYLELIGKNDNDICSNIDFSSHMMGVLPTEQGASVANTNLAPDRLCVSDLTEYRKSVESCGDYYCRLSYSDTDRLMGHIDTTAVRPNWNWIKRRKRHTRANKRLLYNFIEARRICHKNYSVSHLGGIYPFDRVYLWNILFEMAKIFDAGSPAVPALRPILGDFVTRDLSKLLGCNTSNKNVLKMISEAYVLLNKMSNPLHLQSFFTESSSFNVPPFKIFKVEATRFEIHKSALTLSSSLLMLAVVGDALGLDYPESIKSDDLDTANSYLTTREEGLDNLSILYSFIYVLCTMLGNDFTRMVRSASNRYIIEDRNHRESTTGGECTVVGYGVNITNNMTADEKYDFEKNNPGMAGIYEPGLSNLTKREIIDLEKKGDNCPQLNRARSDIRLKAALVNCNDNRGFYEKVYLGNLKHILGMYENVLPSTAPDGVVIPVVAEVKPQRTLVSVTDEIRSRANEMISQETDPSLMTITEKEYRTFYDNIYIVAIWAMRNSTNVRNLKYPMPLRSYIEMDKVNITNSGDTVCAIINVLQILIFGLGEDGISKLFKRYGIKHINDILVKDD